MVLFHSSHPSTPSLPPSLNSLPVLRTTRPLRTLCIFPRKFPLETEISSELQLTGLRLLPSGIVIEFYANLKKNFQNWIILNCFILLYTKSLIKGGGGGG